MENNKKSFVEAMRITREAAKKAVNKETKALEKLVKQSLKNKKK